MNFKLKALLHRVLFRHVYAIVKCTESWRFSNHTAIYVSCLICGKRCVKHVEGNWVLAELTTDYEPAWRLWSR